jgi:hypothetical protein
VTRQCQLYSNLLNATASPWIDTVGWEVSVLLLSVYSTSFFLKSKRFDHKFIFFLIAGQAKE